MSPRDLFAEALAGVLQRPARSALTALGTVLGVGAFVAVLGLTSTASSQIDTRFDALTATEVTVRSTGGAPGDGEDGVFSESADRAASALGGVEAAGVYWPVRLPAEATVTGAPVAGGDGVRTQVVAATPGMLRAAGARLEEGRLFDGFHQETAQPVAVVGAGLASRLGITTLETAPAVFIAGRPFTVVGVVRDTERKADLLLSVTIPAATAARVWGDPDGSEPVEMLISTEVGAAAQVARTVPLALDPVRPERFAAVPPPDPRNLRTSVGSDLEQLFLLLAAVCLLIGAVGIANTTLVAVLERTGEIGLRRALGARARHVTAQFLTESGLLGALGGIVGASIGTVAVVAVSLVQSWTPVLDPGVVAAAPLAGLLTGLVAGLYPAWRASRVPPAEALRR
ncbi:ABC transporter permease [Streptomyces sp. TRM 70351]|uniref:ABC transporter permease n=1 Tax=Streptomyces sp. TRM 70351 TaxID=3116552 RepID=UPI002E7BD0C7|nr:ABC transporter permease [Streptomyces sp. TRM 70351]MEE1929189.1 ABC transporter permease [Streptomyces sp. TRM 70351]